MSPMMLPMSGVDWATWATVDGAGACVVVAGELGAVVAGELGAV